MKRYMSWTVLLAAGSLALAACTKEEPPATSSGSTAPKVTAADCDSLPDPKSADDSPAGRAAASSQGRASREACKRAVAAADKGNGDLARIREIKEMELADKQAQKTSDEKWSQSLKRGGSAPLKE